MSARSVKTPLGSLVLAGILVLLLLVGPGCNTSAPNGGLGEWEKAAFFYAKAKSATADPFLSLNKDETSAASYTADASLASGAQATVGRVTGAAVTPGPSFTMAATGKDMFLNLSKPIQGTVWISDTAVSAAKRAQQTWIRVEAFVGTQRLGGAQFRWDGSAEGAAFTPFHFRFRAELPAIEGDQPISFRITRLSGGLDFVIGTGGAYQSHFEIHYFDFDPLGGAVSVRGKQLIISSPGTTLAEHMAGHERLLKEGALGGDQPNLYIVDGKKEQPGISAALAFGAIPLLALTRAAGRRNALLMAAGLALLGLSGCIGDSGGGPKVSDGSQPSATPTVSARYEENKTLEDIGAGAVRGIVRDENNLSVNRAHVSLLSTSFFTYTNKAGEFKFDKVPAGDYMLRVDADGFVSLEETIKVIRGQIVDLNVTIVHPIDLEANKKLHRHDDWNGETTKTFPEVRFTPGASYGGTWYKLYYDTTINDEIPWIPETRIFPGTITAEVKLSWSGGPAEMGLRVITNGNSTTAQNFVPRKSGEVFRISFFPNEADPGHQKFTNWQFFVHPSTVASTYNAQDRPVQTGTEITASLKIYKGVVPFEPEHTDRWGDRTEMPLKLTGPITIGGTCNHPTVGSFFGPQPGVLQFVPPGTLEIRGTLKWNPYKVGEVAVPTNFEWGLLYKPANVAPAVAMSGLKPVTKTGSAAGGNGIEFTIKVLGSEVDQFYQTTSNWRFYLDDKDAGLPNYPAYSANCAQAYGQSLTLADVRAIKDPAWVDL